MGMQETATWQRPASDEALENVRFINTFRTQKEPIVTIDENSSYNSTFETDESQVRETISANLMGLSAEDMYEDYLNGARRWPLVETVGGSVAV
jgi:hypothetical protein